jgi:zinc and cadmium transporter
VSLVLLGVLSFALLAGSLAAAAVPLRLKPAPHRADLFIAFAAGVLLGAAFLHLMPEAWSELGAKSLLGLLAGVLALFLLERALSELVAHGGEAHAMMHETEGPELLGLAAFFGLSVHTLSDGFALGAALKTTAWPAVFAAIFAHQLPVAFSLSALLRRSGRSARSTLGYCGAFALTVPIGAFAYAGLAQTIPRVPLLPWALAFSAGNFIHLALGDIIPDLRRRHTRLPRLFTGLALGAGTMALLHLVLRD